MAAIDWQPLVGVKHHHIALLFCHYLDSLSIASKIEQRAEEFVIFCSVDDYQTALAEFKQFIEQPNDSKYQRAAWQQAKVEKVNHDRSDSFFQAFFAHAGPVTLVVFACCWLVFLASNLGFAEQIFQQLKYYNQLGIEQALKAPHRLFTAALFHFSWLHIVFNTMWWWQLGGSVERLIGKTSLLQLLIISALVSNLGQYLVSGPNFGGLSGVVYALVGYVWWFGWLMPEKGLNLSKPIIGFLLFWLLLGFTAILPINIANTAHLLGLICGCALAYWQVKQIKAHS